MPNPLYTKFGKYTLLKNINTGGMAEILLAIHVGVEGFEKLTAIKRILPHLSQNQEFVSMFIGEAKLAAQLTHQNIVHIYDFGRIEESYYIAMEYVRGKNIRELLQQCRYKGVGINIPLALDIIGAVCRGLDYAHRKCGLNSEPLNIVHRDINPQNIIISYEGEVKLVDFGIAKAAMHSQETKVGVLKGKVSYMSPEQISGQPLDNRSDIFSLGIVLYELVTGCRLFKGNSEVDTMLKVKQAQIPPPQKINPKVTRKLERVILKALAKDRAERYQSAAELHTDIQEVQHSLDVEASEEISVFIGRLSQETIVRENHELKVLLSRLDPAHTDSAIDLSRGGRAAPKDTGEATTIVKLPPRKRSYWATVLIAGLAVLLLFSAVGYLGVGQIPFKSFAGRFKASFAALQKAETHPAVQAAGTSSPGPPENILPVTAALPEALPESISPPAETPPPGAIKLRSNIAQAAIYMDGRKLDLLTSSAEPVVINHISPNKDHQLKIVWQGNSLWDTSFTINSGEQKELTATLDLSPASLSIASEPPGALVILNRVFKGKTTPTVLDGLSPYKNHYLGLRLPGYHKWDTEVMLEPGKQLDMGRIALKAKAGSLPPPAAARPGTIKLNTNITQAAIYIDGQKQNSLTSSTEAVIINHISPLREHRLKIIRHGYTLWEASFSINSGEQKELTANLDPLPASLSIASEPPGALVILNRVFKGKTTPTVLDGLSPQQTHRIELRLPGYQKWDTKVVLEPGKQMDLGRIILKPKTTSLIRSTIKGTITRLWMVDISNPKLRFRCTYLSG